MAADTRTSYDVLRSSAAGSIGSSVAYFLAADPDFDGTDRR